jgi:hypothetical protein
MPSQLVLDTCEEQSEGMQARIVHVIRDSVGWQRELLNAACAVFMGTHIHTYIHAYAHAHAHARADVATRHRPRLARHDTRAVSGLNYHDDDNDNHDNDDDDNDDNDDDDGDGGGGVSIDECHGDSHGDGDSGSHAYSTGSARISDMITRMNYLCESESLLIEHIQRFPQYLHMIVASGQAGSLQVCVPSQAGSQRAVGRPAGTPMDVVMYIYLDVHERMFICAYVLYIYVYIYMYIYIYVYMYICMDAYMRTYMHS